MKIRPQGLIRGNSEELSAPDAIERMSDHLVRLSRLRAIQKAQGWSDAELARQIGRSQQQVHSWNQGKHIGERLARSIEESLNLPRYDLDRRDEAVDPLFGVSEKTYSGSIALVNTRVTKTARPVPVVPWAEVPVMLEVPNDQAPAKLARLDTYAPSSVRAKFLAMPDESMLPLIAPGDHLLIDPTEVPRAGDTVLVRIIGGEHFVRVFQPRTAYIFEAVSTSGLHLPLSSTSDGAVVVGVMVEHRRYRRPAS